MTALPAELQPWSGILALFPEDLAGELGRMVPRLALAIGTMRAALPIPSGEPDGFTGIARRGSYERLLLTEWLLADEAPDEFARRAAMSEHAFFHLARRSPVRAASSVAIFDAGPDQLGAPRLAHLAALIVLATRAERAGASFAWGLLGAPDGALVPSVTPQSVLSLLQGRTAVASGDEDVAAWAERAARSGWEDAWLVGRSPGPAWRYASLEVRDVLEPERRALAVVARAPGAPAREVELALPDPRASVRLIRDPFAVTAPAPRRQRAPQGPASNLVFAVNGTKLFARAASGEILAYPLPNSPRDALGRPKRYRTRTSGVVAAVGWIKRGLAMLVVTPDTISLEHTTVRGPDLLRRIVQRGESPRLAVPLGSDPLSVLLYRAAPREEVFFLDARRALFRLRDGSPGKAPSTPSVDLLASEVSALAASPTELTFVGRNTDPAEQTARLGRDTLLPGVFEPRPGGTWTVMDLHSDGKAGTRQELLGNGTFEAVVGRELTAVQQYRDQWVIRARSGPEIELSPPSDATVVGVCPTGPSNAPELLVLEGDRRTLSFVGRASSRSLPPATAPILDVAMNPWRGQIAYVTTGGEVVVHTVYEDAPLARFVPDG